MSPLETPVSRCLATTSQPGGKGPVPPARSNNERHTTGASRIQHPRKGSTKGATEFECSQARTCFLIGLCPAGARVVLHHLALVLVRAGQLDRQGEQRGRSGVATRRRRRLGASRRGWRGRGASAAGVALVVHLRGGGRRRRRRRGRGERRQPGVRLVLLVVAPSDPLLLLLTRVAVLVGVRLDGRIRVLTAFLLRGPLGGLLLALLHVLEQRGDGRLLAGLLALHVRTRAETQGAGQAQRCQHEAGAGRRGAACRPGGVRVLVVHRAVVQRPQVPIAHHSENAAPRRARRRRRKARRPPEAARGGKVRAGRGTDKAREPNRMRGALGARRLGRPLPSA